MQTMTTNYDYAIEELEVFQNGIDENFDSSPNGFKNLDNILKENIFGFVKLGICAERIRRYKLWQKKYTDWNDYCKRSLGKSAWYINRNIDAANIVMMLIESGAKILPSCEAQCRPLVKLANGIGAIELISEAWSKVTSMFTADKITADRVASIIENRDPDLEKVGKISPQTLALAKQLAKQEGKTIDELLAELLEDRAETNAIESQPVVEPVPLTIAQSEVLDNLDLQFAGKAVSPTKIIQTVGTTIDRMRAAMYDRYFPRWEPQ